MFTRAVESLTIRLGIGPKSLGTAEKSKIGRVNRVLPAAFHAYIIFPNHQFDNPPVNTYELSMNGPTNHTPGPPGTRELPGRDGPIQLQAAHIHRKRRPATRLECLFLLTLMRGSNMTFGDLMAITIDRGNSFSLVAVGVDF